MIKPPASVPASNVFLTTFNTGTKRASFGYAREAADK